MQGAVDEVIVDRRVESSFDLRGDAAERDPGAAAGDVVNGEALRYEPCGDDIYIGLGEAEAVAEFLGRKPLVIVGRSTVLLLGEKLVERGLLLGSTRKNQRHMLHGHGGGNRAAVEFSASTGHERSLQADGAAVVDGAHDAALLN